MPDETLVAFVIPSRTVGARANPTRDARERVVTFPGDETPEPRPGSGTMTGRDGQPMTEAEIDEWLAARRRIRQPA